MDEALVQDPEHHVDHDDRDEQQDARGPGSSSGRPAPSPGSSSGSWTAASVAPTLFTAATASPSAMPGFRLNESVTDGSWPVCVTDSGPVAEADRGERGQRHELARDRPHVEQLDRGGVRLELGRELHDDLVLVGRRVDRRDLARAVGGVERVLDRLRRDAERGGAVAVDLDVDLRVAQLQVGRHVLQARDARAASPAASGRSERARPCPNPAACTGTGSS